jgi:galactose mutarotase-like enzyme
MMITLQNEYVVAKIDEQGAELKSFVLKDTRQEYMWSGDAAFWGKTSPVLFPIVGSLVDNTYYFGGNAYHLPRHGFARDKKFMVTKLSDREALFTLEYDEETLALYPFRFKLVLRYRLNHSTLACSYEVSNTGDSNMYFSVGGHPAFAVPLIAGTRYTDYYLQFNQPEILVRHKLADGLISNTKEILTLKVANTFSEESAECFLPLHPKLFYEDAIVLKKLASDSVTLGCDLHNRGLRFEFPGFPYLGIWAAKNAPFVCIEPWCGVADHVDHKQRLESKEGIHALGARQLWERTWSVTVF